MSARDIFDSFNKVHVGVVLLASALSAVGGAALGAKLAIDKYGDKLREDADKELQVAIADAKARYKTFVKDEEFSTPEGALEALHPGTAEIAAAALTNYQGITLNLPEPAPTRENLLEVTKNVFTDAAFVREPFDYEAELKRRDPDAPYLITEEEFMEAGPNYEQVNFTYYAGDGVLTNVNDEVIDNIAATVGADNLMRFGDGSNDENIVYVRNIKLEMDIEVAQSVGKYSVEVAGLEDETELRHSADRPRRFRDRDE